MFHVLYAGSRADGRRVPDQHRKVVMAELFFVAACLSTKEFMEEQYS